MHRATVPTCITPRCRSHSASTTPTRLVRASIQAVQQKEKLNEFISAIHEKDELLDTQEDFLIKENKRHVKVKNAYALEVEKCEKLTSELSTSHDLIANLRNENTRLIAKVDSNVCDDSISNLDRKSVV